MLMERVTREHMFQTASLALLAGSMLAGAVWYLAADINAVATADNAARVAQWNQFQETNTTMSQRVSTLEAERAEDREIDKEAFDRLSSAIDRMGSATSVSQDQERAAINDLATAVGKLQAIQELQKRR